MALKNWDANYLIELLAKPQKGELNYDGIESPLTRLEALRELKRLETSGILSKPERRYGVNVHIHTSESFSVFRSPSEAAWVGYRSGIEILGINDHYTIDGHKEFKEACKILGLKATFNIEAMAMSQEAKNEGARYNDPKNPGRVYLCGKGITRNLKPGSASDKLLQTMRRAFRERCREMTEKASIFLSQFDPFLKLDFEEVLKFTPRGNVTERHVAQAIAEKLKKRFSKTEELKEFLAMLLGDFDEAALQREDKFQDLIRNTLLKAGGPAYVEEPPEAFPSIESIVKLFLDYGAIPTYPVLGNPITEREADLDKLLDELEDYKIYAIEVIPKRNTRERLSEILITAKRHGFPVFNGTEHNTKTHEPLIDEFSADPEFAPIFREGACLILGHQILAEYAGKGYVDNNGKLSFNERKFGISFFSFAGKIIWSEEALQWLSKIGETNTLKVVLGLHSVFSDNSAKEFWVKPGFEVPKRILDRIVIKEDRACFKDEDAKISFERIAKDLVVPKS